MYTHIYPKSEKHGGIESHIRFIKDHFVHVVEMFWENDIGSMIEGSTPIFHGITPFTLKQILKYPKRNVILIPHFHPPEHTKRRYTYSLFLIIFRIMTWRKYIRVICFTHSEYTKLKRFINIAKVIIFPIANISPSKVKIKTRNIDFIYIARNDKIKDLNLFINIVKKYPQYTFVLVSDLEGFRELRNLKIYSNVDDDTIEDLLSRSKFFLSTSKYESLGLAIIEAEKFNCVSIMRKNTGYLNIFGSNMMGNVKLSYDSYSDLINLISEKKIVELYPEYEGRMKIDLQKRVSTVAFKNYENIYLDFLNYA